MGGRATTTQPASPITHGRGLAPHFWVLVLGRCVSGAGEAAYVVLVPPFIQQYIPPARRGLFMGIFYGGLPLGLGSA